MKWTLIIRDIPCGLIDHVLNAVTIPTSGTTIVADELYDAYLNTRTREAIWGPAKTWAKQAGRVGSRTNLPS